MSVVSSSLDGPTNGVQEVAVPSRFSSESSTSGSSKQVESPQPASTLFTAESTIPPVHHREDTVSFVDQRDVVPSTAYVPPTNNNRCLVLCFDGTGDSFDADNSNIVNLVSALKKDDKSKQMVYYQSGIGTYTATKSAMPFATKLSLILDAAIASNLGSHVMAGYEFLMQNYTANDRICIFGFSRGAYIARSLAGMLHKVGLLPVDNHQQVPFAYKMYTRTDATGWAQSTAFKKAFTNDVQIDFIGVWDTVDSVGLIPRRLPFTTSNTIVRTFRHAVSLDERRAKFKANLWNWPSDWEKKLGTHRSPPSTPRISMRELHVRGYSLPLPELHFERGGKEPDPEDMDENGEQAKYESHFSKHGRKTRRTDVLEVWFSGNHCDVGGGSVPNGTRNSLARIPLRWMIRECFKAETGIMFNAERLVELGLDPATLYPFVRPRPPPIRIPANEASMCIAPRPPKPSLFSRVFRRMASGQDNFNCPISPVVAPPQHPIHSLHGMEEVEDFNDALAPAYDQLKLKPMWWILELIPLTFRTQNRDDTWNTHFRSNLGRPRKIPHQRPSPKTASEKTTSYLDLPKIKVHRTVLQRRGAKDHKGRYYTNNAHFHCEPEWVD
ncbi:hypothetical protein MKEN_00896500 [Mycena kentingensis (nom. inval.)]|nr:hypothetical protein MKEN_00896500 [Mycena kentingensis (nom. inval.)]